MNLSCNFTHDGTYAPDGRRWMVSDCGMRVATNKQKISHTCLRGIGCQLLSEITTGETPSCCGGTAMIDVGICKLHGPCTPGGSEVDGKPTKSCNDCTDRVVDKLSGDT